MISQVTISVVGKDGNAKDVWFLFETDHPNLFEVNETLAEDGSLYGWRIETEPAGPGRRREVTRFECIIGTSAIVTIILPQAELLPAGSAQVVPA